MLTRSTIHIDAMMNLLSGHVTLLFIAHVLLLPSLNALTIDCQSSGDGDHAHPTNCSKFIRCSGNDQYEYDCPDGLHFSPFESRCASPDKAACNTPEEDIIQVFLPVEEDWVSVGSELWITCEVSGYSFLGWYALDEEIGERGRRRVETSDNITYYLVIENIQRGDQGVYTCRGNSQEKNFTLHVEDDALVNGSISLALPNNTEPSLYIVSNVERLPVGSDVEAECFVNGERFLGWFTPRGDKVGKSGRISLESYDNDYHLKIKNISKADEGNYTCSGTKSNATFHLLIDLTKDTPHVDLQNTTASDSNVSITSQNEYLYEGSNLSTECLVSGQTFVGWYTPRGERVGDKGRIRHESHGEGNHHLVIENVSVLDEGNYTCRGDQHRATFQLHVLNMSEPLPDQENSSDPGVQIPSAEEHHYESTLVSAECFVTGEAFDGWYSPKGERVGDTGRVRFESYGGGDYHLVIENVTVQDEGNYTCKGAQNNATYQLHVLTSDAPDIDPQDNSTDASVFLFFDEDYLSVGSDVLATCLVENENFVGWFDPRGQKVGNQGRVRSENQNTTYYLVIDDARVEDQGVYQCRGSIHSKNYTLVILANDTDSSEVTELPRNRTIEKPENGSSGTTEPPSVPTTTEPDNSDQGTTESPVTPTPSELKPAVTTEKPSTNTVSTWLPVRLADGKHRREGRVEVWYNGIWGSVCDSGWDINEATVVCRMLGYPRAISAFKQSYYTIDQGKIWLDDVSCTGKETSLLDCRHRGWGKVFCNHANQAGVMCANRLTDVNRLE